jgi:threonine/homoserine/homoserine lactone efflux protein
MVNAGAPWAADVYRVGFHPTSSAVCDERIAVRCVPPCPTERPCLFDWLPNPFVVPVGLGIGVLIAAPVGPVNVLCVHRAIQHGLVAGTVAGTGAALADGLIALFAALGVSAITGLVAAYRDPIQAIGGLALLIFGFRMIVSSPHIGPAEPDADLGARAIVRQTIWDLPKAFFLTITNPAAVLGLIAIFGGLSSFVEVRGKVDALTLVAAIVAGSMCWWIGLSALVSRYRDRIDDRWFARINHFAGVALLVFAAVLLGELVLKAVTGTHLDHFRL